MSDISRRSVVALFGAGAVSIAAGCLGGDDDDSPAGDDGTDGSDTGTDGTPLEDLTAADVLSEDDVDGFVADFEIEGEMTMSGTQIVHGDDFYLKEAAGGVERYAIEDVMYIVHGGQCFVENRGDPGEMDDAYVPSEVFRGIPLADVPVTEVTTIDGEEAYVLRHDDLHTTYVSADTGYRIREEWGEGGSAELHSWGETDPISPPVLDCNDS